MASVNFLGMQHRHTDGVYGMPFRCHCLNKGNVYVVVKGGEVDGAYCGACGNDQFTVLVEGKDVFWPVANDHII